MTSDDEENTDEILLIDASNAFNQMNQLSLAMHNIQITCKEIFLYMINDVVAEKSYLKRVQNKLTHMLWYSVNTHTLNNTDFKNFYTRCKRSVAS